MTSLVVLRVPNTKQQPEIQPVVRNRFLGIFGCDTGIDFVLVVESYYTNHYNNNIMVIIKRIIRIIIIIMFDIVLDYNDINFFFLLWFAG